MRRTIFAIAGIATLAFTVDARAGEAGVGWAREGFHDESSSGVTVVERESAPSEENETMADDETTGAGSASGESSRQAEQAERSSSREEFLRSIWTAP